MHSLALGVILALLPSVVAAGQTAPRSEKGKTTGGVTLSFAEKRVAEWTTAVETHAAGTVDQPLRTVASWPREQVTLVVRLVVERLHRLLEAREFVYQQEVAELTGTLIRGLLLHTDIAIAERNSPKGRSDAVILVDGQETRYVGRSAHWPIARQIAAELAKGREAIRLGRSI